MSGRTILVTAFEPFGGETVNASWEAARALDRWRCGEAVVVARRLPCAYGACIAEFVEALERLAPEVVLMTGQAARRGVVSVESVARNRAGAARPDNLGVFCAPMTLSSPPLLKATVSAHEIAQAIRAAGVPARVSTDAGDYVCNHLFYGALSTLIEKAPGMPAVFIHLPATPEQAASRASRRRLATADAARALKAAIMAMTLFCPTARSSASASTISGAGLDTRPAAGKT